MYFFNNKYHNTIKKRSIENAYYCILNDKLEEAQAIFESIDSPRAIWGAILVDIIQGKIIKYPTYFQIRNFIEIDIDFLIKNNKISYIEQLLGSLDYLIKINQESYKYVARVLFENKMYKASKQYLEKSKNVIYADPELHFIFAKYYISSFEYKKAETAINECIKILPDYQPAKILKKTIESLLSKNCLNL